MNKVLVDRELLERADKRLTDWLELNDCECESGHYCGRDDVTRDRNAIRTILAQQAEPAPAQDELEAVEVVGWVDPENIERMKRRELCGFMIEENEDSRRSCAVMTVAQHERIVAALTRPAQTGQQPVLSNCLDLVEKMTVSVDVSTGDDDAFNRLFCKVAGVQEESDGSWTILAVDPEPNFAAPIAQTAPQGLRIVFDGPPGPEAGRFVEVENASGCSVNAGEWRARADGLWELVLHAAQGVE